MCCHFLMCHVLSSEAFAYVVSSSQNPLSAFFHCSESCIIFQGPIQMPHPPWDLSIFFSIKILVFFHCVFPQHILFWGTLQVITCTSISHPRLEVLWRYEACCRKLCIVPSMSICQVFGWILCIVLVFGKSWQYRYLSKMEIASFSFSYYSLSQVERNCLFLILYYHLALT